MVDGGCQMILLPIEAELRRKSLESRWFCLEAFCNFFHFKLADGGRILHALATSCTTWCYVVPELKLYTHRLFNSIHVVRKDLLGAAKFIISNSVLK